jgi:hypothetical protein
MKVALFFHGLLGGGVERVMLNLATGLCVGALRWTWSWGELKVRSCHRFLRMCVS